MANRIYLLGVDTPSSTWSINPKREIIAEGINEIPVFWASLFSSADRQLDIYEYSEKKLQIPNWCVSSAVAKQRLEELRIPIGELLDKRSIHIWHLWIKLG